MKWVQRSRYWMADEPTLPGVWKLRDGGWFTRRRVMDPKRGKQREITRFFPEETPAVDALKWLEDESERVRTGREVAPPSKNRFRDYATSVLEDKVNSGAIWSPKGREKWCYVLEHHLIPAFGELFVDSINSDDVAAWHKRVAAKVKAGDMAASSANTHLGVLRQILPHATLTTPAFRTPPGMETYTDEDPNSLPPATVPVFTAKMKELFPQHYAMTVLGFTTGLRPSSMRPIRRAGPKADLKWGEGHLLVRQSQTIGEAVARTKTGRQQKIPLPLEMVNILHAHVNALNPKQLASDLLFPSEIGGYRTSSVLDKPFRAVGEALKLPYRVTARAMRRTYQDVARAHNIRDIVIRATSGHATEDMQALYSTVGETEQRDALTQILYAVLGGR